MTEKSHPNDCFHMPNIASLHLNDNLTASKGTSIKLSKAENLPKRNRKLRMKGLTGRNSKQLEKMEKLKSAKEVGVNIIFKEEKRK